jgi:predicted DNA-binding transcriptional regulator YafY
LLQNLSKMPINKDAYSRYKLVDERLRSKNKPAPTLLDLQAYVCKKLNKEVSVRTVQTDLQDMRYDKGLGYNAPIAYDRKTKAYCYSEAGYSIDKLPLNEEDLFGLDIAIGILQQFKDLPALRQFQDAITRISASVRTSKEASNSAGFLMLDRPMQYKGVQFMQPIVDAIQNSKHLKLWYQGFARKEPKEHNIQPYFIKEYKGRLYLLAMDIAAGKMPKMLLFSFDRVTKVQETLTSFKPDKVDRENYFAHTLGVSFSTDDPQDIQVRFTKNQAAYVISQPLHASQKIVAETEDFTTFSFRLVVNIELKMKLLELGANAKVLKPQNLIEWLAQETEKMANLYKPSSKTASKKSK